MVREGGFEPPRLTAQAPKACVSASSTTLARSAVLRIYAALREGSKGERSVPAPQVRDRDGSSSAGYPDGEKALRVGARVVGPQEGHVAFVEIVDRVAVLAQVPNRPVGDLCDDEPASQPRIAGRAQRL